MITAVRATERFVDASAVNDGPSSVKVAGPTPKELGGAVLGEMASPPRAHSRIVEKSARDQKVRPRLDSHHEGVTLASGVSWIQQTLPSRIPGIGRHPPAGLRIPQTS